MRMVLVAGLLSISTIGVAQTSDPAASAPKRVLEVAGPSGLVSPAATTSKIICKRDVEIGSWVKGIRRCGTREELRRSEEAARRWTADIQADKGRYNPESLAVDAAAIAPTNG